MKSDLTFLAPDAEFTNPQGVDLKYQHDHILQYLSEEHYFVVLALSPEDKARYFQMVTDYADIIEKITPEAHSPLMTYILTGDPWTGVQDDPNAKIDYDKPKQLIEEYKAWKASSNT